MVVAEAPGADEDRVGKPLVGRAGKYLHSIFNFIGYDTRTDLYLTNIVLCRPPENRPPTSEEITTCSTWLEKQIEIIQPKLIIATGATPAKYFTNNVNNPSFRVGNFINKVSSYRNIPLSVVYHPSYLMRIHHKKDEADSPHRKVLEHLCSILPPKT